MDCFLIVVVLSTFCNAFNHRPVGSFLIHGRDISGAFLITSNSLFLLASLLSICCYSYFTSAADATQASGSWKQVTAVLYLTLALAFLSLVSCQHYLMIFFRIRLCFLNRTKSSRQTRNRTTLFIDNFIASLNKVYKKYKDNPSHIRPESSIIYSRTSLFS
jgi:hypothetical protein